MKPAVTVLALFAAAAFPVLSAGAEFQLPLDPYPLDDACLGWGNQNPNFTRCGAPGLHVADDACAPNGTPVYAVADGVFRFGEEVGHCSNNWGWVSVTEHEQNRGFAVCSVYGHCEPVAGIAPGDSVRKGQQIARINYGCASPHIHFGIYLGAFGAATGSYPQWLLGYLPDQVTCAQHAVPFPGNYVDPVRYVLESVPVDPTTWGRIKALGSAANRSDRSDS